MFETIFVAIDGERGGLDALRLARQLSSSDTGLVLGPLGAKADAARVARSEHADLIVMDSSRDAARLFHGCPVPVAVAPAGYGDHGDGAEDRLRVIGVGFDGQPESRAALRMAEELALEDQATMRVYAVALPNPVTVSRIELRPDEYRRLIAESLDGQLREDVEELDGRVRAAASVIRGDPVEILTARTREGLDLLVLGSRGYGPVRRVLFGGVSSGVLERAECPVLVLPRHAASDHEVSGEATLATTR